MKTGEHEWTSANSSKHQRTPTNIGKHREHIREIMFREFEIQSIDFSLAPSTDGVYQKKRLLIIDLAK